jgi:hypothetical protein
MLLDNTNKGGGGSASAQTVAKQGEFRKPLGAAVLDNTNTKRSSPDG